MNRFCANCGKTIDEGVFCVDCTPAKKIKYIIPLIQVSEYNRTWHKNTWKNFKDLEQVITSRVQEALDKKIDIEIEPFEFKFEKKFKCEVNCYAKIDGVELKLPVKLMYRQCDLGEKEKSQYYEGILQLRNTTEDVFEFVQREINKVLKKGIFVMKSVDTPNGVDLYLTNKNFIKILASQLHNKFGAKVSINAQLFSKNHLTSKDIYRINVLVTFLKFNLGDVIKFSCSGTKRGKEKDNFILVKKMGKLIQGLDLLTGKSVAFESKKINEIEILKEMKTQVISLNPLQVLDPETYQSANVVNSIPTDMDLDDEVLVVKSEVGVFIVGYPLNL